LLGSAAVTVAYPTSISYDRINVSWPSFYDDAQGSVADSTTVFRNGVYGVRGGFLFSVFAAVSGINGGYGGWLFDQPFPTGQSQAIPFRVNLTQPLTVRSVFTNHPLDHLGLWVYHGASFSGIRLSEADTLAMTFAVLDASIPATVRALSGTRATDNGNMSIWQRVDAIPTSLDVPDGSILGTYNAPTRTFRDVAVDGPADVIRAVWQGQSHGYPVEWSVAVPPTTAVIIYPAIPDTVLAEMQFDPAVLGPKSLSMEDYDPANGYDDFVNTECEHSAPHEAHYVRRYATTITSGF
jgi:hypothetical protein